LQVTQRPVVTLRCHPEVFKREFTDKQKKVQDCGNGGFRVVDHPQNLFKLDPRLPNFGFHAAG